MSEPYASKPELRQNLLKLMAKRHVGRDNAITLASLAAHVKLADPAVSQETHRRDLRKAIADLVTYDRIPIVGCREGYYIVADAEERLEGICELTSRLRAIGDRLRAFTGAAQVRLGKQARIIYDLPRDEHALLVDLRASVAETMAKAKRFEEMVTGEADGDAGEAD